MSSDVIEQLRSAEALALGLMIPAMDRGVQRPLTVTELGEIATTSGTAAVALESLAAQKDGAYAERNKLVAALSKLLPSHLARHPDEDTAWEDDWRWIVVINGPAGQMTWHIHDSEREQFNHLDVQTFTWDGHTTDEKYRRLAMLQSWRG
jgi:hypothetical protein